MTIESAKQLVNRKWTTGIIGILVVLCFGSAGLYVFGRDAYFEHQIRQLIEHAYNNQRPGDGRLSGTPYSPKAKLPSPSPELGRAQILLLRRPVSGERAKLQSMLYLASGEWQLFIDTVARSSSKAKEDSATLNNIGVSFLALSDADPNYLLKALDKFDRAAALNPHALEPRFNLVVTSRKLRLARFASETLKRYAELDSQSRWFRELTATDESDDATILDELEEAVKDEDTSKSARLFEQNPELCRRMAMQYALFNEQEPEQLVRFIALQVEQRYGDKTISAMVNPLFGQHRELIITARYLVRQGGESYLRGDLTNSLDAYVRARNFAEKTDSIFDLLWIDLNKVDTAIRTGQFDLARDSLRDIISSAREHQFTWLMAKALSIYGSDIRLTQNYSGLMQFLDDANRLFIRIGASYDRVRPLYYLAVYRYGAGDQDEALKLALECLRLTDKDDTVRMSSLNFLIGSILYRQGLPDGAVVFEKESVLQTQTAKNSTLETVAASTLAQLYESMSARTAAEESLRIAENAFSKIPAGLEQAKAELPLNIVKAKIWVDQKKFKEAESLLEKNLIIYSQRPLRVTNVLSQSLMLVARIYSETGRTSDAAGKFNEAIELVESDDHYLETEKLRIKFDDERRELYDSAIEFEYSHGSHEAAWTYLQKYRAKMFLEFLAHFDSNIQQIRSQALNRSKVQKLVPHDTQVIEYALLKDRLLIWVISDQLFTLRSIAVTRSELEAKVGEVLQKLRNGGDVDRDFEAFGKLLIQPIADLLDPVRTIAVIPDRALHGLPFSAIRYPGTKEYLIQKFSILESPSLSYLLASDASPPGRDAIVGFGSQNDDSSQIQELGSLRNIYPRATTFVGETVEKPIFLAAMNTAPVFHYAGHSVTDAVDPLRSSILLDGNRYGPNTVTAVDIAQQRLFKNAVVVLSSCDSSVGNSRDGVGMRGLTSAFLIGGAGSVVGSLWPVEAESTSDLMISFHRAFSRAKMPVAQALRQAQLTFLHSFPERSNPYYWSGFVVTGNFSALR